MYLLFRNLACQIGIHAVADFFLAETVAEEEHEFGDGTFGSTVVTADDACLKKLEAGFVSSHFDGAGLALGDVDDDDATVCGVFELADEPIFLRGVAGTEGLEYDGFQAGNVQDGVDDAFLDTGEEGEHDDVGIEEVVGLHGARGVGTADEGFVIADVDADFGYWGVVERAEGVEILGVDFGGTVAAH